MSPVEIGAIGVALTQLIKETFPPYPKAAYKLTCVILCVLASVLASETFSPMEVFKRAGTGLVIGLTAAGLYGVTKRMADPESVEKVS